MRQLLQGRLVLTESLQRSNNYHYVRLPFFLPLQQHNRNKSTQARSYQHEKYSRTWFLTLASRGSYTKMEEHIKLLLVDEEQGRKRRKKNENEEKRKEPGREKKKRKGGNDRTKQIDLIEF